MTDAPLAPPNGWHFCAMRDGVPVLRDGTLLVIGRTYRHEGDIEMCNSGYHDSLRAIDALRYAPGPYLCRTRVSGVVDSDDLKRVSRERTALVGADVTDALHRLSWTVAYCALLAEREAGREPDPRSWDAVRVKRRWCAGEAEDAELRAAESAAWPVVTPVTLWAVWAAARSAARSAVGSAAGLAAWAVVGSVAWSAAWAVVGSASSAEGSAAWDRIDDLFAPMLPAELRDA